MDYHNLNSQTVKNNYLLPLITKLINNMGGKKVFTKMDLRWGFNNVRIKKEVSQTSFGHISIKYSTIPTVLKPA